MSTAYTALHYGSHYLEYAIKSVIHEVNHYYVLYASQGSHGAHTDQSLPPGESRAELQAIAHLAAGKKLVWVDGSWTNEGQQRDSIFDYCNKGVILVLDSDEIWADGAAAQAIDAAELTGKKDHRIPIIHYWRSFRRAVLHDPAYPIRIIVPGGEGEGYIHTAPINHMGYAIPSDLLQYKMAIHGHRGQWRKDCNWLNDKWHTNAQIDCHPVGSEYWNPEGINPLKSMPKLMREHPYWDKDIIE